MVSLTLVLGDASKEYTFNKVTFYILLFAILYLIYNFCEFVSVNNG